MPSLGPTLELATDWGAPVVSLDRVQMSQDRVPKDEGQETERGTPDCGQL